MFRSTIDPNTELRNQAKGQERPQITKTISMVLLVRFHFALVILHTAFLRLTLKTGAIHSASARNILSVEYNLMGIISLV